MIYVVRHGQTLFNAEDRVQGRVDSPLTALGEAQAAAMGARLADLRRAEGGAWTLETSPLGRARQTAAIIAAAAGLAEPTVDERLIEASYGDFEGLTRDVLDARWPQFANVTGIFGRAPGGETYADLAERVGAWLAEVRARGEDRRTVAVTHAGTARVLRGLHMGLGEAATRQLDKPQGVIFRLAAGAETRLDCPVGAAA